jgi:hypothetical protein
MRTLPTLTLFLLCAGCGRAPNAAAATQPAPTSDLAAPVLAPMAARERLLEDLEVQKQQARSRASQFDAVTDDDR